jgi:hypothetical protein
MAVGGFFVFLFYFIIVTFQIGADLILQFLKVVLPLLHL